MILLLDNYDSFTYNLFHYLEQVTDEKVVVRRNDGLTVEEAGKFNSIVLSPGPGLPADAGIMMEIIRKYAETIPMLGICLGHQAIGEAFGGKLMNLQNVLHGVQRNVRVVRKNDRLFKGVPEIFSSGHYHSWVLTNDGLSEDVEITAVDASGNIMAISHKHFPLSGVQFHPESVMTDYGLALMRNWIDYTGSYSKIQFADNFIK